MVVVGTNIFTFINKGIIITSKQHLTKHHLILPGIQITIPIENSFQIKLH